MSESQIEYGVVKTFDAFKGWGFITRDKGKDVFFFFTEINSEDKYLCAGEQVTFTIEKHSKGPRAFNITKV
ncbi:retron Se72 family effector protein [Rahnella sp. Larv3_ips]|uniref:retron Se72 family effector protein n=1 Tax=Rahnella sp. Larv3_ips TaxID=1896943 RepID=UPI00197EEEFD|nr:retron Se72 family effector protein [Rahnella sp. Larv3_ips]